MACDLKQLQLGCWRVGREEKAIAMAMWLELDNNDTDIRVDVDK